MGTTCRGEVGGGGGEENGLRVIDTRGRASGKLVEFEKRGLGGRSLCPIAQRPEKFRSTLENKLLSRVRYLSSEQKQGKPKYNNNITRPEKGKKTGGKMPQTQVERCVCSELGQLGEEKSGNHIEQLGGCALISSLEEGVVRARRGGKKRGEKQRRASFIRVVRGRKNARRNVVVTDPRARGGSDREKTKRGAGKPQKRIPQGLIVAFQRGRHVGARNDKQELGGKVKGGEQ